MSTHEPFTLEAGNLKRPDAEARRMAEELVGDFIRYKTKGGVILWSGADVQARSGVVTHSRRPDLRIDLQNTYGDPAKPARRWANFQLQDGQRIGHTSNSYACVLLECDRPYRPDDVRAAWLASLRSSRNARMNWRFLPDAIQREALNALHPHTARDLKHVLDAMMSRGKIGTEAHLPFLHQRVRDALKDLVENKLALRQGDGWVLTGEGTTVTFP